MLSELASHNDDIKRLVEKGYALKIDSSYLVVRDIPYLNDKGNLEIGAFVTKLKYIDKWRIGPPEDHQVFFCGSPPHNIDRTSIPNLGGGATQLALEDKTIVVQRSFSNRPVKAPQAFSNFFDKIESYATIISGPATALFGKTPFTYRVDESEVTDSVFKFHDTLTSRAEIGDLAKRFKDDIVAIIGLGGTGGYILDYLVRTPTKEIRGFDHDDYYVHNAFRSPGRLLPEELGLSKAEVYKARYENFRSGLSINKKLIDASSEAELDGVTFAFVSVDKGSSRSKIFDLLIAKRIPFIDVGMGLDRKRGPISGMLRATYYSAENAAEVRAKGWAELGDAPDDEYRTTIQIAELNAMNAALAVIKYKQLRGFYVDDASPYHLLLRVDDLHIDGE